MSPADLNGPWTWHKVPADAAWSAMERGTHFIRDRDELVIAFTWSEGRARAIAALPDLVDAEARAEAAEGRAARYFKALDKIRDIGADYNLSAYTRLEKIRGLARWGLDAALSLDPLAGPPQADGASGPPAEGEGT